MCAVSQGSPTPLRYPVLLSLAPLPLCPGTKKILSAEMQMGFSDPEQKKKHALNLCRISPTCLRHTPRCLPYSTNSLLSGFWLPLISAGWRGAVIKPKSSGFWPFIALCRRSSAPFRNQPVGRNQREPLFLQAAAACNLSRRLPHLTWGSQQRRLQMAIIRS